MASLRVPFVLPIQSGADVFPGVGRVPAVIRITLGLKPDLPSEMLGEAVKAAQQIVDRRRGDFLGYYTQASNAFQAGIVPVMARHWQFDEGMAMYHMSNGLEYLDIIIYPDLASNHDKEKLDFPPEFLEFRLEWSNDKGGEDWQEDYQDSLPRLNTDRYLAVRAKIKTPTNIRNDALLIDGSRMEHNTPTLPIYHPEKVDPSYTYFTNSFNNAWVGKDMSKGWGVNPNPPSKPDDFTQFDGKFYLLAAEPGSGGTPDKKHATSYLVDLKAFPQGEFEIELRCYWANSYSTDPEPEPDGVDSPFPDVKLTYRLISGAKWCPDDRKVIKPLTKWVDYMRRRPEDQFYKPFVSDGGGGGHQAGPYQYNRLVGGSAANGCGGDFWYYDFFRKATWAVAQYGDNIYFASANGGPRVGEEHFTFDFSAHRDVTMYTQGYVPTDWRPGDPEDQSTANSFNPQPLNDNRFSWPQVATPGWFIDTGELSSAYFWPNDQFDIKPALRSDDPEHGFQKFGMYAYCFDDQGFLGLDQIIAGDPPTFIGKNMAFPSDPRNTDGSFVSDWPTGFKVGIYTPVYSSSNSTGYEGQWRATPCTPRDKIEWFTFKADCFDGVSSAVHVLKAAKQVTTIDGDLDTYSYETVGEYFGTLKFAKGAVSFSEHGPDPTLD